MRRQHLREESVPDVSYCEAQVCLMNGYVYSRAHFDVGNGMKMGPHVCVELYVDSRGALCW